MTMDHRRHANDRIDRQRRVGMILSSALLVLDHEPSVFGRFEAFSGENQRLPCTVQRRICYSFRFHSSDKRQNTSIPYPFPRNSKYSSRSLPITNAES